MRDVPLHLLRVFEVCARLQSYTAAAKELHVTHSAISQQMRRLEDALGVKLLVREHDRMMLTKAGATFFDRVAPALSALRAATMAIRGQPEQAVVRATTIPSLATYWLLPRLARFQSLYKASVSIDTSTVLKTLSAHTFDLAIRHGRGHWWGCDAEKLFDEDLIVVCSPAYRGGDLPRRPTELAGHSLLTYEGSQEWRQWTTQMGLDDLSPKATTTVSDAALMVSATLAGHGIAIGRSAIILEHLRSGELTPLFSAPVRAAYSYYLVTPSAAAHEPQVAHFIDWLRAEARQTRLDLQTLRSSC
jgi:LysR family glycine cleavage system transcriptional activator